MRIGDFVKTESGKRWVLARLTTPETGSVALLARTVTKRGTPEIIVHGCRASDVEHEATFACDRDDAFLFGDRFLQFHKHPETGLNSLVAAMRDDDGKFTAWWWWEIALVALHGMEPPLFVRRVARRLALPEEV